MDDYDVDGLFEDEEANENEGFEVRSQFAFCRSFAFFTQSRSYREKSCAEGFKKEESIAHRTIG